MRDACFARRRWISRESKIEKGTAKYVLADRALDIPIEKTCVLRFCVDELLYGGSFFLENNFKCRLPAEEDRVHCSVTSKASPLRLLLFLLLLLLILLLLSFLFRLAASSRSRRKPRKRSSLPSDIAVPTNPP